MTSKMQISKLHIGYMLIDIANTDFAICAIFITN